MTPRFEVSTVPSDPQLTADALFDGELTIWQHADGYRFGLDALLLASDLVDLPDNATVVELGAGQGAVALSVAHTHPDWHIVALERQTSLLKLLRRNVEVNQLDNVQVIAGDLRDHRYLLEPHSADLVLCNPPYFRPGDRRPSPKKERAAGRHELHGTLADFIAASAYVLKQRGSMQMMTPPLRLPDVLDGLQPTDLRLQSLRFYHANATKDAYLIDYRCRRGGAPDMAVRPPLYIYQDQGIYTDEVARRIGRRRR